MKKLWKFLAVGLATVSCCFAVGCAGDTSSTNDNNELGLGTDAVAEGEVLLSGMNTYRELTGFGRGNNNQITLNRDEQYVKGGDASAKIYFEECGAGRIENTYKPTTDIEPIKAMKMEEVSCWIYNANAYEVDFLFAGYDTASRVLFSKKEVLAASGWTEFSITIDRYQMELINPTFSSFRFVYDTHGENVATFYMDSLKVKTAEDPAESKAKTNFESGEILHFNTISDLTWATPVRRNSYSENITVPIYEYSVVAPFSENGGALKLSVNRLATYRGSTVIWNGSYQLTELTGFKVPQRLLNTIDFRGMKKLSLDVYHDYTQARQMTFVITDEVGTSASVTAWVEPYEWTTISIETFAQIDFTRIVSVEFFYAEYMTFADYNIYVDNLSYVKEA